MIESPVNILSRNSFSCGDCEPRTQCSGSTALLTSRSYYQISVLERGCDSLGRPDTGYRSATVLRSQTGPHSEFETLQSMIRRIPAFQRFFFSQTCPIGIFGPSFTLFDG
ncbi:hypothetical protein TNCV_1217291 [Trichonephila clavipes]|nr:hypothetical protein TNCV_1217291 [Trichonephila clavipes]